MSLRLRLPSALLGAGRSGLRQCGNLSSTIWRKRKNKLFQGCGILAIDEKTGNQPREPSQPRNSRSQKPEVRSQNEPNRKRGMGTGRAVRSGVPEETEKAEETEQAEQFIGPILAVPGVREALQTTAAPVAAQTIMHSAEAKQGLAQTVLEALDKKRS